MPTGGDPILALLHSLADLVVVGTPSRRAIEKQVDTLLRSDPMGAELRDEMLHLLQMSHWPEQKPCAGEGGFPVELVELATRFRRYRLRRVRMPASSPTGGRTSVVMVESLPAAVLFPGVLAERFRLTAREAHVAELLASRLSTREIAEALEISPHTVRRHVEAVLRKVGVRSRAAVADALRRATTNPEG